MKLLAQVEDFFQLSYYSLITMRFMSEDGRIRVKEQVQLRTPDGEAKDTYVASIPHLKSLPDAPRDPYVIVISLPPEFTKQDVPPGTEIWNFRE